MKIVIAVLASVLLTVGAIVGLSVTGIINLSGMFWGESITNSGVEVIKGASKSAELNVPTVEVPMHGMLIPINFSKRQSLLLLDVYLYTPVENEKSLTNDIPKIKNQILKVFSLKPAEYYRDEMFILNLQDDLDYMFKKEKQWQVKEVLVTKAVYQ
ncbi:flagellar basal body-associated FliL family protein [Vibrio ziniensis]|uniref:Flagellar protein FliL n=1 Tax=Vibrio ziniensis TaxID=2711221 RepID=A0A6G7CHF0_9VIBR|nr:flagellar basal body-associated FliL family protein [Vibrio ziniensis]QIH41500.1 flagellar biosynthesis sigma factor [Vibrio ziniensis]